MNNLFFEVLSPMLNIILLAGNIGWQWRYRSVSNQTQLIQTLTAQVLAKDEMIRDLRDQKRQYKLQYHNLLLDSKKEIEHLKGKLQVYEKQGT